MAAITRKQAGFPSPTFLITRSILDTLIHWNDTSIEILRYLKQHRCQ